MGKCRVVGSAAGLFLAGAALMTGCALPIGSFAPDWTLADAAGRPHRLKEYAGRVVVLDFWATWCGPCLKVSPHIQAMHDRFKDRGVAVLAIHYDDQGDPAAYMAKHGYTYTALPDGRSVAKKYGVSRIPTIFILGADGRIVHRQTGFSPGDEKHLADAIESQLGKDPHRPEAPAP